jgi:hypothetical protein
METRREANEYSPEMLKQFGDIAAAESAKHREKEAAAERIAALEKDNADFKKILPILHSRLLDLERLLPKPKRAKVRVAKAPKKRRHGRQ